MNNDIDFVIIWVDGSDPDWIKQKLKYSGALVSKDKIDESACRYRDWDNLKYLFRGIEKFTPWVRKVHFVTCGHVPEWLNLECEKLNFVKHSDYIPKEYLPTFSSHSIELNLHRIKGLSEKFVYFNDDMFIIRPMKNTDFFKDGKPRMEALLNRINANCYNDMMPHIGLNDIGVINSNFTKKDFIKNNFFKLYNIRYGIMSVVRNMLLSVFSGISGFYWHHFPSAFIKGTFLELWKKEYNSLDSTCKNKFRSIADVNQYLFSTWQIMKGNFTPTSIEKRNKVYFNISEEMNNIIGTIIKPTCDMICLNDNDGCKDFDVSKKKIKDAFEKLLPDKSTFERGGLDE